MIVRPEEGDFWCIINFVIFPKKVFLVVAGGGGGAKYLKVPTPPMESYLIFKVYIVKRV